LRIAESEIPNPKSGPSCVIASEKEYVPELMNQSPYVSPEAGSPFLRRAIAQSVHYHGKEE